MPLNFQFSTFNFQLNFAYNVTVKCMIKFYFKPIKRRIHIKAKRYITKKQKHALTFKCTCVFLIFAILFILFDMPIRPVVRENAKYIVKNEVTLMINECVADYLQENNIVLMARCQKR